MSRVTFNIAAKCDKAGRAQNQDNFWICPNLEKPGDNSAVGTDTFIDLSDKGSLLVVADGMGGMKSGEKASEFVIEVIKHEFSGMPESVLASDDSIVSFIKDSIIKADMTIKAYAKEHRESEGMGSTIVLLWLYGSKAYCGWCGDSRIYCFNPQNSLVRLSHDHSYVQSLVDEGKISEEDAFDHPDGNIINRSLGDSGSIANPETKIYPIHRRDVFLLCSDGLCGLVEDSKIESILSENCTSSADALNALWKAGEAKGWTDNCTIEVACIMDGGATPTRKAAGYDADKPKPAAIVKKSTNAVPKPGSKEEAKSTSITIQKNTLIYICILAVVILISLGLIFYASRDNASNEDIENPEEVDEVENGSNTGGNLNGLHFGGSDNNSGGATNQNTQNQNPNSNKPQQSQHQQHQQQQGQGGQPSNTDSNASTPESVTGQYTQEIIGQMQSQNQNSNQAPTPGFRYLIINTYNDIEKINNIIQDIENNGYRTPEQEKSLLEFCKNASNIINDKNNVKGLENPKWKDYKDKYNKIKTTDSIVGKTRSEYRTQVPPKIDNLPSGDGHPETTSSGIQI
ncbi:MAG: PP2C family protein-serine/threonine phosphatase [Muribaculaceae bacterium]